MLSTAEITDLLRISGPAAAKGVDRTVTNQPWPMPSTNAAKNLANKQVRRVWIPAQLEPASQPSPGTRADFAVRQAAIHRLRRPRLPKSPFVLKVFPLPADQLNRMSPPKALC